mgnify:CR=1 FL=1|jgi:hypothetical protein
MSEPTELRNASSKHWYVRVDYEDGAVIAATVLGPAYTRAGETEIFGPFTSETEALSCAKRSAERPAV